MSKGRTPRYYFFKGNLYKRLHINRSADIITAWNYTEGRTEQMSYSGVRKNGELAFTTKQVSGMLNRSVKILKEKIAEGNIRAPQMTYGLDDNRNSYYYMWSEKDIMELHEYMQTVHRGRPRKDGRVTNSGLPTAAELRAMIRQEAVLYVKQGDKFIPTWKAK